jgi:hypothetical protein
MWVWFYAEQFGSNTPAWKFMKSALVTMIVLAVTVAIPIVFGTGGTGYAIASVVVALGLGVASRASGVTAFCMAILVAFLATDIFGVLLLATGLFLAVVILYEINKHRWQGILLSLLLPVLVITCLITADLLASRDGRITGGPLLLLLGLLTLLNAPFDWASLGLTRALLRRGLELVGWWPYLLALVDAASATIIVATLALTMVIGVQAFDAFAQHGGGKAVLSLDELFAGIAAQPADPEYWWVYALLLTTVLPSMINLMIGGASLLRGVPGLSAAILRYLPVGKAVPDFDRPLIALVVTLQVVLGAGLGIAAQALLIVGVMGYIMPWLGFGLLDMAQDVATFNLPSRVGELFGLSL